MAALAFGVAASAHMAIALCHGEQSFDNAVGIQFLHLALNGWGPSGIVGATAFGDHFNPIFLLLTPLYAAWPNALGLQLAKCAVFAAILPGAFLLARPRLGATAGLWTCVLILFSPLFWVSVLADYHTETLAAGLLPWLLLAYDRERLGLCLGVAVVVACGKENLPLVVGGLGVLALAEGRSRRWWLALGGLGGAVFVLAVFVVIPACAPQVEGSIGALLFRRLGSAAGWAEALSDWSLYRWLAVLAFSVGGLVFLDPKRLWPLVPLLLQHGLSARHAERDLDYHYLAPVLPLLVYAGICGAAKLKPANRRPALVALFAFNALLLLACAGSTNHLKHEAGPGPLGRLAALQRQGDVKRLLAEIPANAPAWASIATAAQVASRDRLVLVESLRLGVYLTRTWPFDREGVLADPPRFGLVDARESFGAPPGLHAIDAEGDIVLFADAGDRLVRRSEEPWTREGRIDPGTNGSYRIKLDDASKQPVVQLRLMSGARVVEASRAHRVLFGQATAPGVWEARYQHPAYESGPCSVYARLGTSWVLLTEYR
jgi:uncharacterized membrane protein